MLADISSVDAIYIVCGRTDMRKSIDGLCAIIQEQFSMEIDHALFLFCGRKCDRIKAILKEPDGIVMIYKRPVSYTHLDVYKRQKLYWLVSAMVPSKSPAIQKISRK